MHSAATDTIMSIIMELATNRAVATKGKSVRLMTEAGTIGGDMSNMCITRRMRGSW